MITRESRMGIRRLVREGVPVSRIARKFGVSRQSVYNLLAADAAAVEGGDGADCGGRVPRVSLLDPYRAHVRARLMQFDLHATTLLLELRALGYSGGISILKEFVRSVKEVEARGVIERFETLPGQQAQIDWGDCGVITVNGVPRRLNVFVLVLGFSRMLFARFTLSMRQATLLGCLQEAFGSFGIPRELLLDNMRTVVDAHRVGEEARFNRDFLAFCEHYRTNPIACPPYWPRVKGKVEAGVKFVKNSFLAGRSFVTVADLNAQLDDWLTNVANVRVHGTTGERPVDRFAVEATSLSRVSTVPPFDAREFLVRIVGSDAHVRVAGSSYSVPPSFVGASVHVRARSMQEGEAMDVISGGMVIARHRVTQAGARITTSEHAALIRDAARAARRRAPQKARFEQVPLDVVSLEAFAAQQERLRREAPVVQVRTLQDLLA